MRGEAGEMVGGVREFGGEWAYVYVWLSPFAVDLKTYNTVNRLSSSIK